MPESKMLPAENALYCLSRFEDRRESITAMFGKDCGRRELPLLRCRLQGESIIHP